MPNATTRPIPLEFINEQPAALLRSQEDEFGIRQADMRALPVSGLKVRININMTRIRNYHMISTLLTGAARVLLQHFSILQNDDVDLYLKTLLSG